MAWLVDNWQVLIGVAGSLLGTGGLLAYLRFRRIEVPDANASRRKTDQEAYEQLLQNLSEQGTQIARLYGELDEERKKRRALEDRVDEMENQLIIRDKTITIYRKGVAKLHKQIRDLGHEPAWAFEG